VVALAAEVFAHYNAVRIIRDKYFDGHPFLFQDVEKGLEDTFIALVDNIDTFDGYLKTRAELFKADWEADEKENDGIASAIPGEREGRLTINREVILSKSALKKITDEWMKTSNKQGAKWSDIPELAGLKR